MTDKAPSKRRGRRLPFVAGVLLIAGLLGAMAIEPTRQLLAQRERVSGARADLQRTERANDRLAARIRRLNDPDYLEQRAREQMGLVYPGETSYVVMPGEKRAKAHRNERPVLVQTEREAPFVEGLLHFVGLGWAL